MLYRQAPAVHIWNYYCAIPLLTLFVKAINSFREINFEIVSRRNFQSEYFCIFYYFIASFDG